MRLPVLLALSLLLAASPGDETGRLVPHEVRLPSGTTARYAVWLPPGFTPEHYWPAVVFLHGKPESGTDNARQTEVGLGPALRQRPGGWPAVVVFPQKPDADVSWSARDDLVLTVLAGARASYDQTSSQELIFHLAPYLGLPEPGPQTVIARVFVCPGYEKNAPGLVSLSGRKVYLLNDDIDPDPAVRTPPFGYPLAPTADPQRLTTLESRVGSPDLFAITDVDQALPNLNVV